MIPDASLDISRRHFLTVGGMTVAAAYPSGDRPSHPICFRKQCAQGQTKKIIPLESQGVLSRLNRHLGVPK